MQNGKGEGGAGADSGKKNGGGGEEDEEEERRIFLLVRYIYFNKKQEKEAHLPNAMRQPLGPTPTILHLMATTGVAPTLSRGPRRATALASWPTWVASLGRFRLQEILLFKAAGLLAFKDRPARGQLSPRECRNKAHGTTFRGTNVNGKMS
jgi:hypothetical protein